MRGINGGGGAVCHAMPCHAIPLSASREPACLGHLYAALAHKMEALLYAFSTCLLAVGSECGVGTASLEGVSERGGGGGAGKAAGIWNDKPRSSKTPGCNCRRGLQLEMAVAINCNSSWARQHAGTAGFSAQRAKF